ncbi:MAG: VanZ family protein [Chloroflexi bacterium]|nr:VanZ family protein [Chloroflexota bacterium]
MAKLWHDQRVRWAAPFAWMGLIFYLSSRADYPNLTPPGWPETQDVVAHLVIYATLALLWERALRGTGVRRPALWAFAIAVLYGLSDEFHQSFVPGRTATVFDAATDAVAAGLALSIAAWARRRAEPKHVLNL